MFHCTVSSHAERATDWDVSRVLWLVILSGKESKDESRNHYWSLWASCWIIFSGRHSRNTGVQTIQCHHYTRLHECYICPYRTIHLLLTRTSASLWMSMGGVFLLVLDVFRLESCYINTGLSSNIHGTWQISGAGPMDSKNKSIKRTNPVLRTFYHVLLPSYLIYS